jgi:hypothetical protein
MFHAGGLFPAAGLERTQIAVRRRKWKVVYPQILVRQLGGDLDQMDSSLAHGVVSPNFSSAHAQLMLKVIAIVAAAAFMLMPLTK